MFAKKILIFLLFGLMVFVGSIAVMLLIGKMFPEPDSSTQADQSEQADITAVKQIPQSKISNMVTRMYYNRVADDGNETVSGKKKLLNKIKFSKIVNEVNRLKEEYELKNQELKGREERLSTLKNDLVSERKKMDLIKKDLSSELDRLEETKNAIEQSMAVMGTEESTNMKLLASIYEGMKPKQAASIIAKMDSRTAVKLLKLMDQRNSAKILQDVEPAMAVKLSERIRGHKIE